MNNNLVYKITVYKLILTGALTGMTVDNSWNVAGNALQAEVDCLNEHAGKVRRMCGTSNTYKQVGYKYEEVR